MNFLTHNESMLLYWIISLGANQGNIVIHLKVTNECISFIYRIISLGTSQDSIVGYLKELS